jgi:glycosyltransferase involved in cell wall biosynthesis
VVNRGPFLNKQVIVVPGFGQTHLRDTAILLEKKALLKSIILPFNLVLKEKSLFRRIGILDRAANRNYGISGKLRQSVYLGDLIYQFGLLIHRRLNPHLGIKLESLGFVIYSISCSRKIKRISSTAPLLVRAGFGSKIRKNNPNPFICDVSLVHPAHIKSLVETGKFLEEAVEKYSAIDKLIAQDIANCQLILANSDFVSESLQKIGIPEEKIVVAYLEPESVFKKHADNIMMHSRKPSNYLLFAGTLELRKGINELLELSKSLEIEFPNLELHLVGNWFPSSADVKNQFLAQKNVRIISWMSREELAQKIYEALIFVFPSRAEGSARVVTESMYLGVPVLTTLNSGSPIIDQVTGRLVESNNSKQLNSTVATMISNTRLTESQAQKGRERILEMINQEEYFNQLKKAIHVNQDS